MVASRDFEAALAFGQEGEHIVADFLLRRGVAVAPLYQFQNLGRAPVIVWSADNEHVSKILPDLTCFGRKAFFAESKRKRRWVPDKYGRGLETGFNERCYKEYRAVGDRTGAPVWVFFLHENEEPTGLYAGELRRLIPHARLWDGLHPAGHRINPPMIFFPLSVLARVATLEDLGC